MAEQQQPQREIKMGPVDLALYGFILCVHYPLKFTLATLNISKEAAVKTVSLPRRILNYTIETVSSIKQTSEEKLSHTISYAQNATSPAVDATKNTISSTTNYAANTTFSAVNAARNTFLATVGLARNTATAAVNAALYVPRKTISITKNTTSAATNLAYNTVSSGVEIARNSLAYAGSLLSQAKAEANHQFDTKINEPKLQYEKALTETANSVTDYTLDKANEIKKESAGIIRKGVNFVRNASYLGLDFLKQLTEDVNIAEQNDQKISEPKNQFERALQRFQVAAFETERQALRSEISKLQDELKKVQQSGPSFDRERLKCDSQIHDLQDQLTRIHLTYTQQKQHLLSEFERERLQYKQEMQKLNHQLVQAQVSYEQLCKKQVTGFDKERHQYQEEIQKLLHKVAKLKQDLSKYKDTNHSEDINEEEDDTSVEDPYVTEAFHKIEAIKKEIHDLKKKTAEFLGTEKDEAYLKINESILGNLIKLHNVESKGYNVVRKKRKEALRFAQKVQDELKSKV